MRSTIVIAFLVVAISSSTYGVDNIFGVPIDPNGFHTLNGERVQKEVQAKLDLAFEIDKLTNKVPPNERAWLGEFKRMVTAEREIIEKLNVPLSQINTDNLEHINDLNLRNQISDEIYGKLSKGLRDYVKMLKTFDFTQTVWVNRSFWENPCTEFLEKINAEHPVGLSAKLLKEAFKKAATDVSTAKSNIFATLSNFTKSLEPQYKRSQTVMTEIRELNRYAIPNTEKMVKKSAKSLATKLKSLQSSIENVNNIPAVFQCFMDKRSWLDEIRTQLNYIEKVHTHLNIQLAGV